MDEADLRRSQFVPHKSLPFAVERAEGAYLITPDGRRILDAAGGAIVANIGHGRHEVAEAAAQAIEECSYVVPLFATPHRARLVERLQSNWLPSGLTQCLFVSGGSESVEAAIRLARHHHVASGSPERWKVIGTDLSYHGTSLGALAAGGHANRRKGYEPLLAAYPKVRAPYCLECFTGRCEKRCRETAADALEEVILAEGPETVSAFICEPVVGSAGGVVVPPPNYWPRVREICDQYGVLLIADEVMSGFGRTGMNFGVDHWDVVPDIMVSGKGLTGGYMPMGAVFARASVVEPIAARGEDVMFYTYSNFPAACAVADKVLEIMEREDLVARAATMGEQVSAKLARIREHPNVASVRGIGLMWGIELVQDRDTLTHFPAEKRMVNRVMAAGLERGVFLYPGGSGVAQDCVMLGPPFTITDADVDLMVGVLEDAIDAAVARG